MLTVTLVVAALSLTGIGPAADARAADGTTTLSGTISGFDGRTLSSARVSVYQAGEHVASADAGARGEYAVIGLAPGRYDVLITYCCSSAAYISEWGDGTHGATQATPTLLVEGSNRLDVVLDAGGYLTGTVTGSGEEIPATISLIPIDPIIPGQVRRAGTSLGRIWSDPLPPGRYGIVVTESGWLSEDHNGVKTSTPTEPAIDIGLGETVTLAIDLDPAGEISGTVYIDNRDGTRAPAPRASVLLENIDISNSRASSAVTDEDGTYVFRGLDGRYLLQFSDEETLPEFYGGSRVEEGAQIVTVRNNRVVSGIDVTLDVGGRIAMTTRLQAAPGRPPVYSDYGDYLAFERFDEITGRYIAAPSSGLGYGIDAAFGTSAPLEPGTYRVIAHARDQIGADFDDSTFSVPYSAQVNDVVVRAAEVTTVGWVTLTTDYYDPIHPPAPDALPRDAGSFVSVAPVRLLDTRAGTGSPA
ncbi:carboxypeptidase-like regulatory domain-containing protein, partial [Planococcus sp. APC 4015]|nr:carboxypeptidase-like regulatory domain-containing protein [Planococcus sp. APC 4015]